MSFLFPVELSKALPQQIFPQSRTLRRAFLITASRPSLTWWNKNCLKARSRSPRRLVSSAVTTRASRSGVSRAQPRLTLQEVRVLSSEPSEQTVHYYCAALVTRLKLFRCSQESIVSEECPFRSWLRPSSGSIGLTCPECTAAPQAR